MTAGESMNGGIVAGGDGDIEGGQLVELVETSMLPTDATSDPPSDAEAPADDAPVAITDDQITPLLPKTERPKINIFTISYPRRKSNKEQVIRTSESDTSPFTQFIIWAWSGSRYSGLVCMAISSVIYCTMDVVSEFFTGQSIPLFEMVFTRCTLLLILSFVWLKRTGQPIFGPKNVNTLMALRAVIGYFSLLSFIYCIQRLPLSQAIVLSFTTPIMASIVARFILHEKLKITEIGGLATSFFGVLFLFQPMVITKGAVPNAVGNNEYLRGSHHIYAVLVGLCSSIFGGVSYCLTKAGAKTTDQPVLTVFAFGLFASPAAGICTFAFQNFVLPSFYSLLLMIVLGVLAFFAEITLARGLQLEKTSRVANVLYLEAALSQLLRMGTSRIASFSRLVGCSLILISASCTMYFGHERD
ncbi:PREDICTED: probable transport protein YPL264C isoform X2 [Ipomoea nil]|uniref:probable transport protein YPL264C isoform X2 n=1 Tax=Ipomoea nil TaxID=35883 RepID=UPI0009008DF9|nr:PREDICTED: probable transport protein YPL264C isoform X2 [Ipomoea nil]